jgi:hypothetical protein
MVKAAPLAVLLSAHARTAPAPVAEAKSAQAAPVAAPAETASPKPAAPAKPEVKDDAAVRELTNRLRQLTFDRSPQALIQAAKERRKEGEADAAEAFRLAVLFGDWGTVKKTLDRVDPKDGKAVFDKLLVALKTSPEEIKQKIFQTNANTFVEINGSRMTIQDALILKDTIKERKKVLENLKIHQKTVASNVSREQKAFDDRVEAIINALTDKTASPEQIFAIRERTRAEQTALCGLSIVDSCNVDGFIIELEKEIKAIELDLDTELSALHECVHE